MLSGSERLEGTYTTPCSIGVAELCSCTPSTVPPLSLGIEVRKTGCKCLSRPSAQHLLCGYLPGQVRGHGGHDQILIGDSAGRRQDSWKNHGTVQPQQREQAPYLQPYRPLENLLSCGCKLRIGMRERDRKSTR